MSVSACVSDLSAYSLPSRPGLSHAGLSRGFGSACQMQLRDWPPRAARTTAQVASMLTWRLGLPS
eukprot:270856-Alexandrium_andersonii.AAC.1